MEKGKDTWRVTHFCVTPIIYSDAHENNHDHDIWDTLFFYVCHEGIFFCGVHNHSVSSSAIKQWEKDRLVAKLKKPLYIQPGEVLYVNSRHEIAKSKLQHDSQADPEPESLGRWHEWVIEN